MVLKKKIWFALGVLICSIAISVISILSVLEYQQSSEKRKLINVLGEDQYYKLETVEYEFKRIYTFDGYPDYIESGHDMKTIFEP